MKLAIIGDPLNELKVAMDTTLLVTGEANRRGHEVYYTTPRDLFLQNGEPAARWQRLHYMLEDRQSPAERALPPQTATTSEFDIVLMRQDPPVDEKYISITQMLDFSKTPVINRPADVRSFSEKISVMHLPGLSPGSLVSIDPDTIIDFVGRQPQGCVLKPLNQFNGRGVVRLTIDNPDLRSLIQAGTENYTKFVIVQTFVPQVANGDKRVFFVDGEPIGRMNRVPPTGEWRANIHLGAKPAPFELSDRDNEIVAGVVQLLKGYDLPIACIDIIGDYLTEINVTSPSGIPEINSIYGKGHEARIVDYLEQRQSLAAAPKGPRELG